MYDKAEKACKDIMDIGAYSIEDSYSTNFDIKNEDSKENIFVILYDRVYTSGDSNSFYLHTLTLEAASQATFNIPAAPWSGFSLPTGLFPNIRRTRSSQKSELVIRSSSRPKRKGSWFRIYSCLPRRKILQ